MDSGPRRLTGRHPFSVFSAETAPLASSRVPWRPDMTDPLPTRRQRTADRQRSRRRIGGDAGATALSAPGGVGSHAERCAGGAVQEGGSMRRRVAKLSVAVGVGMTSLIGVLASPAWAPSIHTLPADTTREDCYEGGWRA